MADAETKFAPCACPPEREDWRISGEIRGEAIDLIEYHCESCGKYYVKRFDKEEA